LDPATETVTEVALTFPFEVQFTRIGHSFKSVIDVNPVTYQSACRVDVFGRLSFYQEKPVDPDHYTDVPLSDSFLEYTKEHPTAFNSSNPAARGEALFMGRDEIWTYGNNCSFFEIGFRMRVPLVKVIVARNGWYVFLDGWTAFLSIAAPLFILVWVALEALFKSGFIPAHANLEAELESERIPKFNR
jgi:hypothetical protein